MHHAYWTGTCCHKTPTFLLAFHCAIEVLLLCLNPFCLNPFYRFLSNRVSRQNLLSLFGRNQSRIAHKMSAYLKQASNFRHNPAYCNAVETLPDTLVNRTDTPELPKKQRHRVRKRSNPDSGESNRIESEQRSPHFPSVSLCIAFASII